MGYGWMVLVFTMIVVESRVIVKLCRYHEEVGDGWNALALEARSIRVASLPQNLKLGGVPSTQPPSLVSITTVHIPQ